MNATHSYKGFCVVCLTLAVCIVPDKLYLDSSSAHILVFLRIVSSLTASDLDVCAQCTGTRLEEPISVQSRVSRNQRELVCLCGRNSKVLCQPRAAKLLLAVDHVFGVFLLPLPCCLLPRCILPEGDSSPPPRSSSSLSVSDSPLERHTFAQSPLFRYKYTIQAF